MERHLEHVLRAWVVHVQHGAAVAGALKYLKTVDRPGLRAVVLLPDSGSRYMSKIYNDKWMEENGFVGPTIELGTVAEIMPSLSTPITIPQETSLGDAVQLMKQHAISQVPVTNGNTVLGLVHERTLLDHALNPGGQSMPVSEIADADFCTVTSNTEVQVLADLLRRFRVALVMQNGTLTGVLSRIDIIDYIAKKSG